MKSALINLIAFKAGWAAVILAAAARQPEFGLLAVAIVVALHLQDRIDHLTGVHLARTPRVEPEMYILAAAAGIGLVWESLLVAGGLLVYDAGTLAQGLAPYWIVAMWVLFATTLNVGMRWLRKSVFVAAAAGAIGGPMAFIAGEAAGAVSFTEPTVTLLAIGAGWMILLPALVQLSRRFDGYGTVYAVH